MVKPEEHKWIVKNYEYEGNILDDFLKDYKIFRCPYCNFEYMNFKNIAHIFCPNCGQLMIFTKNVEE